MKPLEFLTVLVFMGPLCLMELSFIAYTVFNVYQKIVERRGPIVCARTDLAGHS